MNKHVPPPDDAKATPSKPQPAKGDARQPAPEDRAKTSPPAGRRVSWTRLGLAIAGLAGAAGVGLFLWWPSLNAPKVGYSFTKASLGSVVVGVHAPAVVEARDTFAVVATVGGRVESIAVKSGDRVAKGQRLALLVSDSARVELIAAQAELAARQADVARAEADAGEARSAVARARGDAKPGAVDAAEARLARAVANANESRALLRAGEVSLADARATVAALDVRAPFDGFVLKNDLQPGQRAIARGQPLLTLVGDLTHVNLRANFSENSLGTLHAGQRAEFTTSAFPQKTFAATLAGLDLWPKREIAAGKVIVTYPATLTAANPDGILRPGMSADAAIVTAEAKNVLVVPNTALTFRPSQNIEAEFPPLKASSSGPRMGRVWVLENDSLTPRDVALGLSDGRITQVVSGLRQGENVVSGAFVSAGSNS